MASVSDDSTDDLEPIDILLKCPHCEKRLATGIDTVGRVFPCPECKEAVTVPEHDLTFACPLCTWGLATVTALIGDSFHCPNCEELIQVPAQSITPAPEPKLRLKNRTNERDENTAGGTSSTSHDNSVMAHASDYRLKCYKCGQVMTLSAEQYSSARWVYTPFACPKCKSSILVPGSPSPPPRPSSTHSRSSFGASVGQGMGCLLWSGLILIAIVVIGVSMDNSNTAGVKRGSAERILSTQERYEAKAELLATHMVRQLHDAKMLTSWSERDYKYFYWAVLAINGECPKAETIANQFTDYEFRRGPMRITRLAGAHHSKAELAKKAQDLTRYISISAASDSGIPLHMVYLDSLPSILLKMKDMGWYHSQFRKMAGIKSTYVPSVPNYEPDENESEKARAQEQRRQEKLRVEQEIQMEQERRERYERTYASHIRNFSSPVGKEVQLSMRGGGKLNGTVIAIGEHSVEIAVGGAAVTVEQDQLSRQSRQLCFASDYAEHKMNPSYEDEAANNASSVERSRSRQSTYSRQNRSTSSRSPALKFSQENQRIKRIDQSSGNIRRLGE